MRKARETRERPISHATVTSYKARAEGHIYFYLDRDEGGASIPMRVDQVAVDLYQNSLGQRRQIIRGLRKRELLPIEDFRYYIDRLTAVQNGFGDRIAIGQGRDVRDVPHPLGSDGELTYRYGIADSIRLTVPTLPQPIRVYEVEVRPRDEDRPGFVGSVFLEAETGALVRMVFGFTPASYVDPRTDRISVTLEHSWEESLWLPYRQIVEVRREMPELDLPVGTVIRATLEVIDYEFNPELEPWFFSGPPLLLRPYGPADSSVFRAGLTDRMAEEGLSPVSWASIEAEGRRVARESLVSGLPRVRVYADRFSSVLRANRAEGLHFGLGVSYAPNQSLKLDALPGYGTADRTLTGRLRGRWMVGDGGTATIVLHAHDLRDAGPFPGASRAVNTLSALVRNHDYTDPWFATGVRVGLDRAVGLSSSIGVDVHWEEMTAARSPANFRSGEPGRPLRPIDEGALGGASGEFVHRRGGLTGWGGEAALTGSVGRWDGGANATLAARIEGTLAPEDLSRRVSLSLAAGAAWGSLPRQLHFLLGGRGTLPGHPYRAYGGRRFVLARGEASLDVVPGWLSARLLAGAGAVAVTPGALADGWRVEGTGGVLGYAGVGLAAVQDLVRLDGAWGVPGGTFELVFSVDPAFRPYL